eukprot:2685445-Pyramimonas_sp.AAC.1
MTAAPARRFSDLSRVPCLISDHLSSVEEGRRSPSDAPGSARRAAPWRALRATVARQGRWPPPSGWIPSSKSLAEAIELGLDFQDRLGYSWADIFAIAALDLAGPAECL